MPSASRSRRSRGRCRRPTKKRSIAHSPGAFARSARLAAGRIVEPADAEPAVVERVERDREATVACCYFDGLDEVRQPLAIAGSAQARLVRALAEVVQRDDRIALPVEPKT